MRLFLQDPFLTAGQRVFVFLAIATLVTWFAWRREIAIRTRIVLDEAARAAPDVRHRVDFLTAPRDEIALLPGVGPARAREFIRMRERGFAPIHVLDLHAVAGFGPVTIARIAQHATFGKGEHPP